MFDCEWKFLRYTLRISFYDHFELNKTKPNGIVLANDKRSVKNYDVLKNIYSLWSLRWLWLLNIKVGGQTRYTSLTIRDFIFHGKYLNKYWVIKCVILTNFLFKNMFLKKNPSCLWLFCCVKLSVWKKLSPEELLAWALH